jgi:hypothetical protein
MFIMIVMGLLIGFVIVWATEPVMMRKLFGDVVWACRCYATPISWRWWQVKKDIVVWMALTCGEGVCWLNAGDGVSVFGVDNAWACANV